MSATGYVYEMLDKNQRFDEFIWTCARAFGPLVLMRDDPLESRKSWSLMSTMPFVSGRSRLTWRKCEPSPDQQVALGEQLKQQHLETCREYLAERQATNVKINAMLDQVQAWTPPTPDHVGLKEFMIQQLTVSLEDEDYYGNSLKEAEAKTPGRF